MSMVYLFVKCDGFMSSFEEHSVGACGILGTVYIFVLEYSVYNCFLCLKHMFINLEKEIIYKINYYYWLFYFFFLLFINFLNRIN